MANKNERYNEIIHTKVDENALPNEIEAQLNALMKEELEILKTEDNVLQPILRAKTGIKPKQLAEMSVNVGLKPDLSGNTIPIPINTNLLTGGLKNITNYYIDAIAGRKALIANCTVMGRSGFFAKKSMLSVSGINLNHDEESCGTVNPVKYEIKTKTHLERLIGRMYRPLTSRKYSILQGNETQLIGQSIYVKSPITCACPDNTVCSHCYGPLLYHTNKDGVCIGSYSGAIITNP